MNAPHPIELERGSDPVGHQVEWCPNCGNPMRRSWHGRRRRKPILVCTACNSAWLLQKPFGNQVAWQRVASLIDKLGGMLARPTLIGAVVMFLAWTAATSIWTARAVECTSTYKWKCPAASQPEPWIQSEFAGVLAFLSTVLALVLLPAVAARRTGRRRWLALCPVLIAIGTVSGLIMSEYIMELSYPDAYRNDPWFGLNLLLAGFSVLPLVALVSAAFGRFSPR